MRDHKLVTVYHSQGMLAAQVVKAKLESAGVPALLKYEAVGQILGLTVDGLGLVEVLVPAQWADEARALVDEQESTLVVDGEDEV
ncbi:MAG: DUF2007 domain-containing protein [Chloroflexi bacterium]|nr:DUF2007 domain-containing protein [Chloroflexota bacterium]